MDSSFHCIERAVPYIHATPNVPPVHASIAQGGAVGLLNSAGSRALGNLHSKAETWIVLELCNNHSLSAHMDAGSLHALLGLSPTANTLADMVGGWVSLLASVCWVFGCLGMLGVWVFGQVGELAGECVLVSQWGLFCAASF